VQLDTTNTTGGIRRAAKPITKSFKQQKIHESQETTETNQIKIKNS
jgi:hypothetical protein